MTDSFSEFLSEHRGEHRTSFNRGCLVVGNALQIAGLCLSLRGGWRKGGTLAAVGYGVVIAGHLREGNLPRAFETARMHPVWTLRADAAIARDMLANRR